MVSKTSLLVVAVLVVSTFASRSHHEEGRHHNRVYECSGNGRILKIKGEDRCSCIAGFTGEQCDEVDRSAHRAEKLEREMKEKEKETIRAVHVQSTKNFKHSENCDLPNEIYIDSACACREGFSGDLCDESESTEQEDPLVLHRCRGYDANPCRPNYFCLYDDWRCFFTVYCPSMNGWCFPNRLSSNMFSKIAEAASGEKVDDRENNDRDD